MPDEPTGGGAADWHPGWRPSRAGWSSACQRSCSLAVFWAMPTSYLTGVAAAGGIAFINSVGNLGGFFGPYAIGWALEATGSYAGGMAILAVSMTIAAVLVLALGRFPRLAFAA